MIKRGEVIKAVKIMRGEVHPRTETLKQLISSLRVYKSRGEFDGYLESALECLELAGYEIERDK